MDDTADYCSQDDEAEDKKIPQHFNIDKSTDDGPAPDARRSLEKQLAAAAPQRQKDLLFNAVWPRIVQLIPNGTDEERLAFTNEFMNEDNDHILDCIFDPALRVLGLSLLNMQLVARTRHAEAIAIQAAENTAAALAQKDLASREAEEIAAVAERAAEEARLSALSEAAEASALAHEVIDDQLKASKQAEALI